MEEFDRIQFFVSRTTNGIYWDPSGDVIGKDLFDMCPGFNTASKQLMTSTSVSTLFSKDLPVRVRHFRVL